MKIFSVSCPYQISRSVVSDSLRPMNHSTPGLPVIHQLPEFTQTHVHWASDAIQPSHPLSSPAPPAPLESFPMSPLLAWGGQSTGLSALASFLQKKSQSLFKFMSTESGIPSNHLILCRPLLLLPPIFPSIWVFSNELVLRIRQQSIGVSASASVLPTKIQDWFPLGLNGLISLLSKGLSRVLSSATVRKHQFFGAQHFYGPTLTSIHDYWKNHSFD